MLRGLNPPGPQGTQGKCEKECEQAAAARTASTDGTPMVLQRPANLVQTLPNSLCTSTPQGWGCHPMQSARTWGPRS